MEINIWMAVGFLLAAYAAVANDSLQTLGTYLTSSRTRTPRAIQMVFLCAVTLTVLMVGWRVNGGDLAWGRLEPFAVPDPFTWVYVIPPIIVLVLTAWGAPVSTSFLVLTAFAPETIPGLLEHSLSGYLLAFGMGLSAWGLGFWMLERWVFRTLEHHEEPSRIWPSLQWMSTGFLWSMWLIQDLANLFVFLPRQLGLGPMLLCSGSLCLGLCVLVAIGGGPIQAVLRSKTNASDPRSATVIDCMFGVCLFCKAVLSPFPLSTTWVFLGLLGGREVALRLRERHVNEVFTNRAGGSLKDILGADLAKASIGLVVSVLVALGIQPLIAWSAG